MQDAWSIQVHGVAGPPFILLEGAKTSRRKFFSISRQHFVAGVQILDTCVIVSSAMLALETVNACLPQSTGLPTATGCLFAAALLSPVMLSVLVAFGVCDFRTLTKGRQSAGLAALAWSVVAGPLVVVGLMHVAVGSAARVWLVAWFTLGLIMVAGIHLLSAATFIPLRRNGLLTYNICIVGSGDVASACVEQARRDPLGVAVLGYFGQSRDGLSGVPRLGAISDVSSVLEHNPPDAVVLALPDDADTCFAAAANSLRRLPVRILYVPPVLTSRGMRPVLRGRTSDIGDMPLFEIADRPLVGWRWLLKDCQDRTLAAVALVLCAPLLVVIALCIKADDGGPVFFRQLRRGYGGRTFSIYKFRTMNVSASTESLKRLTLTRRNDPRVSRLGGFLRRTSLDELPQLLNVLLGHMWIVGPRPHSPFAEAAGRIYADAVEDYSARYRVKPGITGWAQVNGWRGQTDTLEKIAKRVEHDLFYIENWSVLLDIRIVLRTLWCVFADDSAF